MISNANYIDCTPRNNHTQRNRYSPNLYTDSWYPVTIIRESSYCALIVVIEIIQQWTIVIS